MARILILLSAISVAYAEGAVGTAPAGPAGPSDGGGLPEGAQALVSCCGRASVRAKKRKRSCTI